MLFIPLYHGVISREAFEADAFEQRFQKHLPIDEFENQIQWFCSNFKMTTVSEFYDVFRSDSSKPIIKNYAMVAFDDVYANFKTHGLPILEKYNCPVAVFVSSGYIQGTSMSWTDEIERVVMNSSASYIHIFNTRVSTSSVEDRIASVLKLKTLLKSMRPDRRDEAMKVLLSQYDRGGGLVKASMLTWEDYMDLKNHPLITFCHHSHHHNVLMNETMEGLREDIAMNISILGQGNYFAFPFGVKNLHFNESTKKLIMQFGFKAAFSVEEWPDYGKDDIFEIPRKEMHVGDHLEVFNYTGVQYANN